MNDNAINNFFFNYVKSERYLYKYIFKTILAGFPCYHTLTSIFGFKT